MSDVEDLSGSDVDSDDEFSTHKKSKISKEKQIYGIFADTSEEDEPNDTQKVNFVSQGSKASSMVIKKRYAESSDEDEKPRKVAKITISQTNFKLFSHGMGEIGAWEKNTKGIGSKLMSKMGYVPGGGLGKNLQGIATPIEAIQRKGRGTIGAYGSEKTKGSSKSEGRKCNQEKQSKDAIKGKSTNAHDKFRTKRNKKYVTIDEQRLEIDEDVPPLGVLKTSDIKVIDMSGKHAKVFTGYENIRQASAPNIDYIDLSLDEEAFEEPENMKQFSEIIETLEDELFHIDRKLVHEKDKFEVLNADFEKFKKIYDREEADIRAMEEIANILDECKDSCDNEPLVVALNTCSDCFSFLKLDFEDEINRLDIFTEIMEFIYPAVERAFKNWDALKHAKEGAQIMALLDEVLTLLPQPGQDSYAVIPGCPHKLKPFDVILYESVFPKISLAVNSWDVRNPQQMIEILQWWDVILQKWMMTKLFDYFIFGRLLSAIQNWDFGTEMSTIASCLKPWIRDIGDKMIIISAVIRQRLSTFLSSWNPLPGDANIVTKGCLDILEVTDRHAFVVEHVLPKLVKQLNNASISHLDSCFRPLQLLLEWADCIPHQILVDTLSKHFFSKLTQTLQLWIRSRLIDTAEANKLVLNWTSSIPHRVLMPCIH